MSRVERPEDLVGAPIPDQRLASSDGTTLGFRDRVGVGSLVLFFYLRDATPG